VAAAEPALVAIVGPTGAGKSALALELAQAHGGEIVSCDSLQVYVGLDIGSAKPTPAERAAVPHHLIDVAEPDAEFSAAAYARLARRALEDIAARGRLPILAGGSGLYLRALVSGLFEGPPRDEALRRRLEALAARFGRRRLHRLLRHVDPRAAARIEPNDLVRCVRALEVYRATRRPISAHQDAPTHPLSGFRLELFGLDPPRELLRQRVEARTDAMLGAGLVEETRAVLARHPAGVPALRGIGYRQAVRVLRGELDLEAARRDIVTETMQYAKRQRTWFRRQVQVLWRPAAAELRAEIEAWLAA
jgi:tRNA dimethylallyltransferase